MNQTKKTPAGGNLTGAIAETAEQTTYLNHFTPRSKFEQPLPVAELLRVRGKFVFVHCPYCEQPHMHGNPLPGENRNRVPHCAPGKRQRGAEYFIGGEA